MAGVRDRVTSPLFRPGDLVLLTGKGCDRPAPELMAIWTVHQFRGNQAIIKFEPQHQTVEGLEELGFRNFPASWLVLYRRGDGDEEDDF
jgi:hypothetical protein